MNRERTSEAWEFYPNWYTPKLSDSIPSDDKKYAKFLSQLRAQETPEPLGLDTCPDFGLLLEKLETIFIAKVKKARGPKETKDFFGTLLKRIIQSLRELTEDQDITDPKREAIFSLFKDVDSLAYNVVMIKSVEVHDGVMDALRVALEAKTHFVFPGLPKEYILQPVPGRPGKYDKDHDLLTKKKIELERLGNLANDVKQIWIQHPPKDARRHKLQYELLSKKLNEDLEKANDPKQVLIEVEKDRGKKFKEPYRTNMFNAWQKRANRAVRYMNHLVSARHRRQRGRD